MNSIFKLYKDSFQGLSKEIWILTLITLVNRSGTMVLLFMSVYLTTQLDYTLSRAGIVMSCFGVGSFIGSYVGGKLTDSIGFYKVMYGSLILSGLSFFLLLFVESFEYMCLVVILTSSLADSFRPANYASVKAYSKKENQTRSLSLIRLAVNLGFSLGPFLGGLLAESVGYYWLFILDGGTCILSGICLLIFLPEKRIEKEKIVAKVIEKTESVFANKRFRLFLISLFLVSFAFFQLFTSYPVFLNDQFSFTESKIGLLMALNGFLIAVFEMPLVFLVEKKYKKINLITLGVFLTGFSFLFYTIDTQWVLIPIVSMIIVTFGEMINFPFSSSWALNQSNESNAGKYMGAFTMTFSLSHIISPYAGFKLIEVFGYQVMWGVMFVSCIIGGLILVKVSKMPKLIAS